MNAHFYSTVARGGLAGLMIGLAVMGCAPDLAPGSNDDPEVIVRDNGGPQVRHTDNGNGVIDTEVDATADDRWVYLSLADGAQLDVDDPHKDPQWDLAFQRFHIKVNGGSSGSAGVEVAMLEDMPFDALMSAPTDGYETDAEDGDDDDEHPDYALRQWYEYDFMTHVLTPYPVVYVVRSGASSQHYKLEIDDYYDDAGTSGHLSFHWARLAAP